jgi:hypothetical protein
MLPLNSLRERPKQGPCMYACLKRHYLSLLSHFSTPADAFSIVVADRSNANQKFLVRLLSSPPCASHYVRACNFELDSHPGRQAFLFSRCRTDSPAVILSPFAVVRWDSALAATAEHCSLPRLCSRRGEYPSLPNIWWSPFSSRTFDP